MTKPKLLLLLRLISIFTIALVLKHHYSTASVNGLKWVLAPTTFLVENITGINFSFESHAGYMSPDNTFLIAASCSGINFLIIAFLLLTLRPLLRGSEVNAWTLPIALFVSYFMTLAANTTRIVTALALRTSDISIAGFRPDEVHRVEGIVVYFAFLLLLFFVAEKRSAGGILTSPALHYGLGFLLALYYAVTLGIPLIRGSYQEYSSFWQHSVYVLIVPLVIIIPIAVALDLRRYLSRNDPGLR